MGMRIRPRPLPGAAGGATRGNAAGRIRAPGRFAAARVDRLGNYRPNAWGLAMIGRSLRPAVFALGVAALLATQLAEAQWVMVARRAIGRVEQMSQAPASGGAGYESAAVMIDAPADKVFAAVVRGVRNAPGITVTREDGSARLIQFTNGQQVAGIKVSALGDDLSHLLVSSAHTEAQPNATALVTDSVLRVCKDMSVECSRAAQ